MHSKVALLLLSLLLCRQPSNYETHSINLATMNAWNLLYSYLYVPQWYIAVSFNKCNLCKSFWIKAPAKCPQCKRKCQWYCSLISSFFHWFATFIHKWNPLSTAPSNDARPLVRTSTAALTSWRFGHSLQLHTWLLTMKLFMDMRHTVTAMVPTITSSGWDATSRPCSLNSRLNMVPVV